MALKDFLLLVEKKPLEMTKEMLKQAIKQLPHWVLANKFGKSDLSWKHKSWEEALKNPVEECSIADANLILSEVAPDTHTVMLDLDIEAQLIPSTTPGHSHLYIDRQLSWEQYKTLLTALAEAGIISNGYKEASFAKGATALRVPWVKKEPGDMSSDGTQNLTTGQVEAQIISGGEWKTVGYTSEVSLGPFSIGEQKPVAELTKEDIGNYVNKIADAKLEAKADVLAEWEKELLGLLEEKENDA